MKSFSLTRRKAARTGILSSRMLYGSQYVFRKVGQEVRAWNSTSAGATARQFSTASPMASARKGRHGMRKRVPMLVG